MRRPGQYGDSGVNAYVAGQMHHSPGQRMDNKSAQFEGRLEAFTPERDNLYSTSKADGQWRWERGGSKMPNSLGSQMFNEGQGSGDTSRSYFQGQRPETKMILEKQNNSDTRSQRNEDMDLGYEENSPLKTFQSLDQKFYDDIVKLAKEQDDAEDAENARHREKINAINAQYEEQLAALRTRHSNRRDEFLRRESSTRQQEYQQAVVRYPKSSVRANDPHCYGGFAASTAAAGAVDAHRGYDDEQYDSYKERARFLGGARDHGFERRGPYPGGRVYDNGSRYY